MKTIEVTMRFIVNAEDGIDISELDSKLVACFYHEDTYGTEHFLPKEDGLTIVEYSDATIIEF